VIKKPTKPRTGKVTKRFARFKDEDGKLKQRANANPKAAPLNPAIETAAQNLAKQLRMVLPGVKIVLLEFRGEEGATHGKVNLTLDVRWTSIAEADAHNRELLRSELLELFRHQSYEVGDTRFALHMEHNTSQAGMGLDAERITLDEARSCLDVLTHNVRDQYMRGWLRTGNPEQPQPPGGPRSQQIAPVPGSTAWLAYVLGNRDRIVVATSTVTRGAVYLEDLPWAEQAERIVQWATENRTPEIER
jgi:hypothetical protein